MRPGPEAGTGEGRESLPTLAAARLLRGVDVSGRRRTVPSTLPRPAVIPERSPLALFHRPKAPPRPLRTRDVRPQKMQSSRKVLLSIFLQLHPNRKQHRLHRIITSHKSLARMTLGNLDHALTARVFFRCPFPAVSDTIHALPDTLKTPSHGLHNLFLS
jgi:hypothetical protein